MLDKIADREILRGEVARQITCPRTGLVLDWRRAVLVTAAKDGVMPVSTALDATAWDDAEQEIRGRLEALGRTVTVIDGRELQRATRRP